MVETVNEAVGVLRAGAGWIDMPIENARATIAAYIMKSIRLYRSQTKTSLFLATRIQRGSLTREPQITSLVTTKFDSMGDMLIWPTIMATEKVPQILT